VSDIMVCEFRKMQKLDFFDSLNSYRRVVAESLNPICSGVLKNESVGLNRLSILFYALT